MNAALSVLVASGTTLVATAGLMVLGASPLAAVPIGILLGLAAWATFILWMDPEGFSR